MGSASWRREPVAVIEMLEKIHQGTAATTGSYVELAKDKDSDVQA
jgi:hypothetical protein